LRQRKWLGQGFDFLGYHFEVGRRWVRKKSNQALRDKIREKTRRNRSGSMEEIVRDLNPTLRGWFGYFKHAARSGLNEVDQFVRRRLRAILLRRHHKRGKGYSLLPHRLWPNAYFARLGLFTMKEAHAVACRSR
jgi:RNA-directed DNA polymerase